MSKFAVHELADGAAVVGLELEHLHPARGVDPEAITREMVALITSLEGQTGARVVLQIVARPNVEEPERGELDVHVLGVVDRGDKGQRVRLELLGEDLLDLLEAPPIRWTFSPVGDAAALERVLQPVDGRHFAEIVRREEPCQPVEWSREAGFLSDPSDPPADRTLWSTWTFGPASPDMRRLAGVLLSQDEPVAIRVSLTPTDLTPAERHELERATFELGNRVEQQGLMRTSLRTIESMLYLRPLFELQCVVASTEPISRALLSSLGHAVSEPAQHGVSAAFLAGGFATLWGGIEVASEELAADFAALRPCTPPPSLSPPGLRRLRRLLGAWEAANVFRLPIADDDVFPGMEQFDLPDLAVPVVDLARRGIRVGKLVGRHDTGVLVEDEERFRHLYVSGQTGTGKSTLLYNLALQDIERGLGVAVLDPHGDLVESLLAVIPDERIDDVVLIDPADPVAVVGVNLLEAESDIQRQFLVSELVEMFYSMFDPNRQGIVGPRYESMLRAAAGLLLARPDQPASLLDIATIFADRAVRDHLLEDLADPILAEYWLGDIGQNKSNELAEVISWFRSKFETFRMSPLVRNVVGQASSTISFSEILSGQKIVLANLSKGLLGEHNSALLGRVLFMRLWSAVLERAAVTRDERPDFYVYIDEFQNMTTDSLPDVLSEARKFRVGLTLANQFFTQVHESTRDAIMGNVGTRVTFRLGPKDADPFAYWLGNDVSSRDLISLPNFHAVAALSQRGVPLDPFVLRTDAPRPSGDVDRAERVRAASRRNWARPVEELDPEFFARWVHVRGSIAQRTVGPPPTDTASTESSRGSSSFLDEWLRRRAERGADDSRGA